MKTSKRGISLIVLVITIIVMIILAAAIILSLNSSNISGRANEAKLSSDQANKKEAASVYVSEYELKVAKGKIDKSTITADVYVKAEMNKAGIDTTDVAVTDEGQILVGVAALFVNKKVPMGTEVQGYTPTGKSTYETSGNENTDKSGAKQSDEIEREDKVSWQYMGIDENGNALIVATTTDSSPIMTLGGKGGYLNGPTELNNACKSLYSSSMGTARNIDLDDVLRVLEYTGKRGEYMRADGSRQLTYTPETVKEISEKENYDIANFGNNVPENGKDIGTYKSDAIRIYELGNASDYNTDKQDLVFLGIPYWISTSCVQVDIDGNCVKFSVRYVSKGSDEAVDFLMTCNSSPDSERSDSFAIRPVVELNPSVQMTYNGTKVTLK